MMKRIFTAIPMFFFGIMIQLLLLWLSPDAKCCWVVYIMVSLITIVHLTISYLLLLFKGIRRTVGIIITGSIINFVALCAGFILMLLDVRTMNSLFAESIIGVFYMTTVLFLSLTIEDNNMVDIPDEELDVIEDWDYEDSDKSNYMLPYTRV